MQKCPKQSYHTEEMLKFKNLTARSTWYAIWGIGKLMLKIHIIEKNERNSLAH